MAVKLTARYITGTIRQLFPHVEPLSTSRQLSDNGLVLSYTLLTCTPQRGVTAGSWFTWLSRQERAPESAREEAASAPVLTGRGVTLAPGRP